MKGFKWIIMAGFMAGLFLSGTAVRAGEVVTVFAAASLKNALDAIADTYDGQVVLSYGGSAIMARQIALGAPADVVVLANVKWMDWLTDDGAVDPAQTIELLRNSLVVIAPEGALPLAKTGQDLPARLGDGRLAIGQTTGVPAGIYGRQWLETAGLWPQLENRLAEVENVRVALALVARGETPLGVTYATDALAEPRVQVVYEVPRDLHAEILYPAAATTAKGHAFLGYLKGPVAGEIFRQHGFDPI